MAQNKINKLELTWIGKEDALLAVEPRLLIENERYNWGGNNRHHVQWKALAWQYAYSR